MRCPYSHREIHPRTRAYFADEGEYADCDYFPLHDVIVTDFKKIGQACVRILQWIREQKSNREIPSSCPPASWNPRGTDADDYGFLLIDGGGGLRNCPVSVRRLCADARPKKT